MMCALCLQSTDTLQTALDMQVAQASAAGYFGGYTAKMQDVGRREIDAMREAVTRRLEVEAKAPQPEMFKAYSKRLLKDLEAKGVIRTAVESVNLSLCTNHSDILKAECLRTCPTVTFPASLLLKREEIETGKVAGASVIATL